MSLLFLDAALDREVVIQSTIGENRGWKEWKPMTMLEFEPRTVAVPLREDPAGVFRVGQGRVLLELVLHAFKAGATP